MIRTPSINCIEFPSVVRVELSAIKKGSTLTVIDAKGRCIAKIDDDLAVSISREEEQRLLAFLCWRNRLSNMAGKYYQRVEKQRQDPWIIKCDVWRVSLRWRRNRKKPTRKTNILYGGKTRAAVICWQSACRLLLIQYANRFYEAKRRKENPWRLWSQTVYSNLNKKRAIRAESKAKKSGKSHG